MQRISIASLAVTLAACGSGGGGAGGTASFSGTIHGQSFSANESISTNNTGGAASTGEVVISDRTGLCGLAARNVRPKSSKLLSIVISASNQPPSASGSFTVVSPSATNPPANSAMVYFDALDASCAETTQSATGASGTITLTKADAGAYGGFFDVIMDSGDHVTGSFNATSCNDTLTDAGQTCG